MDIWYAHLDEDELRTGIRNAVAGAARQEEKPGKAGKKAGRKGRQGWLRSVRDFARKEWPFGQFG